MHNIMVSCTPTQWRIQLSFPKHKQDIRSKLLYLLEDVSPPSHSVISLLLTFGGIMWVLTNGRNLSDFQRRLTSQWRHATVRVINCPGVAGLTREQAQLVCLMACRDGYWCGDGLLRRILDRRHQLQMGERKRQISRSAWYSTAPVYCRRLQDWFRHRTNSDRYVVWTQSQSVIVLCPNKRYVITPRNRAHDNRYAIAHCHCEHENRVLKVEYSRHVIEVSYSTLELIVYDGDLAKAVLHLRNLRQYLFNVTLLVIDFLWRLYASSSNQRHHDDIII